MNTLEYYDRNAVEFSESTKYAAFDEIQNIFADAIKPGARILDFGCGSGRDTRAFLERGFYVDALDGSKELCAIAGEYAGVPVRHILFQDFKAFDCYDGIWACASLLHLTKREMHDVLQNIRNALKIGGVLYCSFKYGDFEGERNGRYFTDLTEDTFQILIQDISGMTIDRSWITGDVRTGRSSERWLNLLLHRCE